MEYRTTGLLQIQLIVSGQFARRGIFHRQTFEIPSKNFVDRKWALHSARLEKRKLDCD